MIATDSSIRTTLRIPGNWAHPRELMERVPDGFRLTRDTLISPEGAEFEFSPLPPDDDFPRVFESACRRPATADELKLVGGYTVNVALTGPGGSMQGALSMMRAGAAIVRAGGAGVFIDNCCLAHGGRTWIEMSEDGGPDALSFAFVRIVRGREDVWTIGMHVLGLRDILMRRSDVEPDGDKIIEAVRYSCNRGEPMDDGHLWADVTGSRFRAVTTRDDEFDSNSPMHNPLGRLRLVNINDTADHD